MGFDRFAYYQASRGSGFPGVSCLFESDISRTSCSQQFEVSSRAKNSRKKKKKGKERVAEKGTWVEKN